MILSHGLAEYNKDFPKIKLALYDVSCIYYFYGKARSINKG